MIDIESIFDFRVITFIIGALIPILIYWYSTVTHDYWKKRGIPYEKPRFFLAPILFPKRPVQEIEIERYNKYGKIFGHFDTAFSTTEPVLTIGDPELIKDILVKDFSTVPHRRNIVGSVDTLVAKMLTSLRGEDWKRVRAIVSPTFTTGKIKRVLGIFKDCSRTLVQNFKTATQRGHQIEIKELYGAFTMDVIASSAFSTKIDSHNNPQNEFVKAAQNIFAQSVGIRSLLLFFIPRIVLKTIFKIMPTPRSGLIFFKEATLAIIAERKKTGQTRNDFLQLLIDASNEVSKEEKWEENSEDIAANYDDDASSHPVFKNTSSKRLSIDELVAQCIIFFLAGYHTSAMTLSFATYLLALNQDEQEKLFQELKEVLKETNGELTYEALQKMKYLDNVISETLRLYPPATRLERIADKEYTIGNTGITISKEMAVQIPVCAIHRDPEYYPDPERFNPDRFNPEERAKQIPFTYMPFGAGPRNCIGMRFALLEIKVCLAYILSTFHLKTSPETKVPLEFKGGVNTLLRPTDIVLKTEIREDCPLKE